MSLHELIITQVYIRNIILLILLSRAIYRQIEIARERSTRILIKMYRYQIQCTWNNLHQLRYWNKLHQLCSKSKDWKAK